MTDRIKTAVIGVGHFGRRHAEKYAALPACELVAVVDLDEQRAAKLAGELGTASLRDYRELLGKVEAVSIVVPTIAHFEVAQFFIENGVHVLIEKPITTSVEEARALTRLAEERDVILQVGHIERFSPVYMALEERVSQPLYLECYRISAFQNRGTDVDVVLDLMIHDIDLILGLVQAPAVSAEAIGAPVLSPQEDLVNARIRFANGSVANITASRVSAKSDRRMRIFQKECYIVVDFVAGTLVQQQKGEGEMLPGIPAIRKTSLELPKSDNLAKEVAAFLDCVVSQQKPRVTGKAGSEALRVALMVTESLREHREALVAAGVI
jgi:predicted dehydrogenase